MADLREKLIQMRARYVSQMAGCDEKTEALKIQKQQLQGAIYVIDQALAEDKPEEKSTKDTKES